jgi:hypothetical protein
MQEDGSTVVMQINKSPEQYVYRQHHLEKAQKKRADLTREALAHSIWSLDSYEHSSYRLNP